MQIRVLGSLEVVADRDVVELGPPKQRAVLALLALHAGEIVSTDRLIDLLWGDNPPRTAAHSVQIYVSEIRKIVEPIGGQGLLETRHPGYRLRIARESVDALAFEQLVADGRHAVESGAVDAAEQGHGLLETALALWHGPALSDFTYEPFAEPYIARATELRIDAIELVAAHELSTGRTTDALVRAEEALREDPLRERALELAMLALYRVGRAADAIRRYEDFRATLDAELGIEPSPELEELHTRILRRDPGLVPHHDANRHRRRRSDDPGGPTSIP